MVTLWQISEIFMKGIIKKILQKLIGFDNYLFVFSLFTISTLKLNKKEGDFLYFLGMLPDEGNVLDIGANIGIMTVHFARKLPHTKIYAFEPIPQNIKALNRVIRYYKLTNVSVIETALGNKNGTTSMVMPVVKSVKMQGLSHVINEEIIEYNEGQKFITPIHKLDSYDELKDSKTKVIGIKIDVENYEYFVLEGGKELLKAYKPIVYAELWDNENREKCFELMGELGYIPNALLHNQLVPFDGIKVDTQNFFFLPKK